MASTVSLGLNKTILAFIFSGLTFAASAADYKDGDTHKNDYKWFQFNLMQSVDAKVPYDAHNDTYLEMEFGGRSGIFDLYGYVDIFDIFDRKQDDRHDSDNFLQKSLLVYPWMDYLKLIYRLAPLRNGICRP